MQNDCYCFVSIVIVVDVKEQIDLVGCVMGIVGNDSVLGLIIGYDDLYIVWCCQFGDEKIDVFYGFCSFIDFDILVDFIGVEDD